MLIFVIIFICLLITVFFLFLIYLFSIGFFSSSFSNSGPFECGFLCFSNYGINFSISFFYIALMFLIFDVEILLLCFYPFFVQYSSTYTFSVFTILVLIFVCTLYEWAGGVLSWA